VEIAVVEAVVREWKKSVKLPITLFQHFAAALAEFGRLPGCHGLDPSLDPSQNQGKGGYDGGKKDGSFVGADAGFVEGAWI
jgi:hypothetical protein